jgi:urea transporter
MASNTAEKAFLGFVPFIGLWFWRIQRQVGRLFGGDKSMIFGIEAMLIGSAAAFVANDSGVVMASIMIAMTVCVLLYSVLEEGARRWEGS